jgi:hypothetical protein
VGNDLNPFAHLLTAAKVEPGDRVETRTRLTALRLAWGSEARAWTQLGEAVVATARTSDAMVGGGRVGGVPAPGSGRGPAARDEGVPVEVALAFHPRTLGQLLAVRSQLRLEDRVDRFLAAALTGILHGKSASYLSEVMPNTFSMAPRYVRDFVERTAFRSPDRDVFDGLGLKLGRLYRHGLPSAPGVALLGDARDVAPRAREVLRARALPERARLVVTSPPYLRVVKYGYYNWLRAWLCGFDPQAIDETLDDAHRRAPYLAFMRTVLASLAPALTDDAIVVLVIGDVETDRGRRIADGIGLAEAVWEEAAGPAGYRLAGIALDDVHPVRKMTKLWGEEAGRATKLDRILVLGTTDAARRRAVAGATLPIDWRWPPRGLRVL